MRKHFSFIVGICSLPIWRWNQCRIWSLGEIGSGLHFENNVPVTLKRLVWSKETNYKTPAEMMRPQAKMAMRKKRWGRRWDSKYQEPRRICDQLIGRKEERRDTEDSLDSGQEPGVCLLGRNAGGWAGFLFYACGMQKYSAGSDCLSQSWEWRMPDMSSASTGPAYLP